MKTVEFKGAVREKLGKSASAELRKQELVPCVLYGGEEPIHFSTHTLSFKELIYTPDTYLVKIDLDGKNVEAILQDAQFDPVSDDIIHADFIQVIEGKPVVVNIPVKTVGRAKGVLAGGALSLVLRKLKVRGLVNQLPEYIEIDMTPIKLGGSYKVKDVKLAEGVEILNAPSAVIAGVKVTRTARLGGGEEDEEEEGAEEGATETPAAEASE